MKRKIALLLAAICLCLTACCEEPEAETIPQEVPAEAPRIESTEQMPPQSIELAGPWHLDSGKNDLKAFADSLDLFPGYGEWGAGMEIRSNGQMSWYIGAESWHGTYTVENEVIHAQLTSDLDQSTQLWDFRITAENHAAGLEMAYQGMTIYWAYGDREG